MKLENYKGFLTWYAHYSVFSKKNYKSYEYDMDIFSYNMTYLKFLKFLIATSILFIEEVL